LKPGKTGGTIKKPHRTITSNSGATTHPMYNIATRYAKGGNVSSKTKSPFDDLAQSMGEDTMVAVKEGERILTPVQNEMWEQWTASLPKLMDLSDSIKIPDFSKNVARGEQAHVSLYCDMGALLNYKALLTAGTDVSLAMGKDIQVQGMEYATVITEQIASSPVQIQDVKLFNPQGGFTSFLIPAVLILVVQQSLLLGVGTITGTERDRRRKGLLLPTNKHFRHPARVVLGKAFAYLPIYFVMSYWVFFIVPRLFGMTQVGERGELMLFLFPFLLACTFFAIAMSFFSREREMPFLIFVFTSVPLMFISGISWPKSAIPEYWVWFGKLFPSSFGIDGFVKINNTGATLSEVLPEFWGLCILMVFYFIVACLLYKRECKKLKINMV